MGYTATRGRLEGDVRGALEQWLPSRLAPDGHTDFAISEFSAPDAGYSGKTVFFTASWANFDGERSEHALVLRTQATDHQLFTEPDAVRQAEVMRILGRHPGVPTPTIVLTERDSSVLGTPFYLMKRVHGRTPSDVPSWHKRGWTAELSAAERESLCDNALRSLVAVHRIDDPADLDPDARQYVVYRFRLDMSQLPRPLQIGTGNQTDWNLSLSRLLRITPESRP